MFYTGAVTYNDQVVITNVRQKNLLQKALESLEMVQNSISQGMPEDFYTIDLEDAYASLGKIIGEQIEDDLADEIFSKFCMGK
jgi:tRNA modification GTPase